MKITETPTGHILIIDGEQAKLECLSLGDYGKEHNLKADFLGLHEDIDGVEHRELLPLTEKWVITISTQYGCSMGCRFCDVPKVGLGINASTNDMISQVVACMEMHPETTWSDRLNVHFARMGEPTWNRAVIETSIIFKNDPAFWCFNIHPVVSTMMPAGNSGLSNFLIDWCLLKNNIYEGNAGLQLSINSTDETQRRDMFNGSSLSLKEIGEEVKTLPAPIGRKYTLNFALSDGFKIDPKRLLRYFDPTYWLCKITPIHETSASQKNKLCTSNGYDNYLPYRDTEEALKSAGYDVIVFVPSREEDESRITCGNAILADTSKAKRYTP